METALVSPSALTGEDKAAALPRLSRDMEDRSALKPSHWLAGLLFAHVLGDLMLSSCFHRKATLLGVDGTRSFALCGCRVGI